MTGQQPGPGWFQGPDGRWYRPAAVGRPGEPRKENTERTWFTELTKTLQELMQTIHQGLVKLKSRSYGHHDRDYSNHDHSDYSNHAPFSASPDFPSPAVTRALPSCDPIELDKRL